MAKKKQGHRLGTKTPLHIRGKFNPFPKHRASVHPKDHPLRDTLSFKRHGLFAKKERKIGSVKQSFRPFGKLRKERRKERSIFAK